LSYATPTEMPVLLPGFFLKISYTEIMELFIMTVINAYSCLQKEKVTKGAQELH
jgi:hypothetical protein